MSTREWRMLQEKERVLLERHRNVFPVKLSSLAKELGLKVIASTLPPGISGELRPVEGGFTISVNRHDSPARQRFTVAHEIAHYLLHRDHIGQGITDDALYRSALSDAREAEANRLAAEILMPQRAVNELVARQVGLSNDEIAKKLAAVFNVSEVAMKIRLGLI